MQCAWMLSASSVGENDLATQSAAQSVRELSTVTTEVASTTLVSVTVVEARQGVEVCPAECATPLSRALLDNERRRSLHVCQTAS